MNVPTDDDDEPLYRVCRPCARGTTTSADCPVCGGTGFEVVDVGLSHARSARRAASREAAQSAGKAEYDRVMSWPNRLRIFLRRWFPA